MCVAVTEVIACGNEEREVPRESAQAKAKTCEAGMETGTQGERSEREGQGERRDRDVRERVGGRLRQGDTDTNLPEIPSAIRSTVAM